MTSFERTEFKMTVIKAGSMLISACGICITIGWHLSDWNTWRKDIDKRVTRTEQQLTFKEARK